MTHFILERRRLKDGDANLSNMSHLTIKLCDALHLLAFDKILTVSVSRSSVYTKKGPSTTINEHRKSAKHNYVS